MTSFASRLGRIVAALTLAGALAGCLVSEARVDLGPRAQPLKPGLYASFEDDGAPENAFVVEIDSDGVYRHDEFYLAFYESGVAEDLYFIAYTDRDEEQTLYGLAEARGDEIVYPTVMCEDAPEEVLAAHGMSQGSGADGGCLISSAAQGRAVLTEIWRRLPKDRHRERFVRQTEFRR